jgi:tetratricopeptide (TPR) repeat protein
MNSYKNSYNIFNKIDRKRQMGYSLIGISYGYMAIGEIDSALKYSEEALLSAREIIDRQNEINALKYIGEIYFWIGNNEDALDIFLQLYNLANSIGDISNFGISNQYLGLLMLRSGNYEKSFRYFEKADSVWTQLDYQEERVWTQAAWALAILRTGDEKTAEVKSSQTEILLKEIVQLKYYPTSVYYNLYNYYITIGDTSIALQYLSSANDEIHDRLKFISNSDDKNTYMKKNIMYSEIVDLYAKYFD